MSFLNDLSAIFPTSIGSTLGLTGGAGSTDPSSVDPFAPYRQQMVSELEQLLAGNTSSITSSPEYTSLLQQGTQAAQRQAAATGMAGSGNEAYALANVGSSAAQQTFQDQFSLLSQFSGAAGYSPSTMAQLYGQKSTLANALPSTILSTLGSFL